MRNALLLVGLWLAGWAWDCPLFAQVPPQFSPVEIGSNREIALTLSGQASAYYQIDVASDLKNWNTLATFNSGASSSLQYTDSAAPFLTARYYRAQQLSGSNIFVGDHLWTTNGDVVMQPRSHASLLLSWQGKTIYVDPTNTVPFAGIPKADLILITHAHSDHFNTTAVNTVRETNAVIVTSQDVYNQLLAAQRPSTVVLGYGLSTNLFGIDVQTVAAYNSYHPFGTANAYVLTMGGKRIFISGDTGNTPEMRALTNIDVAFVCMNQPYTMTVGQATNAVTSFHPKVVYPYHYRDQSGAIVNAGVFKQQLNPESGIEVRLRKWY